VQQIEEKLYARKNKNKQTIATKTTKKTRKTMYEVKFLHLKFSSSFAASWNIQSSPSNFSILFFLSINLH